MESEATVLKSGVNAMEGLVNNRSTSEYNANSEEGEDLTITRETAEEELVTSVT